MRLYTNGTARSAVVHGILGIVTAAQTMALFSEEPSMTGIAIMLGHPLAYAFAGMVKRQGFSEVATPTAPKARRLPKNSSPSSARSKLSASTTVHPAYRERSCRSTKSGGMAGRYATPEVAECVLWITCGNVPAGTAAEAFSRLWGFRPSVQDIISRDGCWVADMLASPEGLLRFAAEKEAAAQKSARRKPPSRRPTSATMRGGWATPDTWTTGGRSGAAR